jgi:hypothetical protein
MAQQARTFRVFVSSTFSDLKAERNALQERVFPRLRQLAAEHGCRFQAIDLRWGVSEEASLDQQAMNICLGEIQRCQLTTPRPNFIVLLGDRYGWCPPPSQIPADEFEKIMKHIQDTADIALLEEWYSLDENAVPPEWCLKARQRGSEYEAYDDWQLVESRLQSILASAVARMNLIDQQELPYTASATEQEINAGALQVSEAPEHVFCFFREITNFPQDFSAEEFQSELKARLGEEYEDGLPKPVLEDYLKEIYQMDPVSTAKDFDEQIKALLENAPKGSLEAEFLSILRGWLVDFTGKDFQNLIEQDWMPDKDAHTSQRQLKERLEEHIPGNVFHYRVQWTGRGITTDHIGSLSRELEQCILMLEDGYSPQNLCEAVWCSLARVILEEIKHPHEIVLDEELVVNIQPDEALDGEGLNHHKFAEERLRFFVGRREMLSKIAGYLEDNQRRTLAIVGAGGTGKSALMSKAIQQTQESYPKAEIVYRFIGATPGSSDGRSLLDSLCHEISRRYGADEGDIPTDYRELVPELSKRMQLGTSDKPLILFLDSLDQLSESQAARSLIWLPNELPEHVSVIASTREEDTFENLKVKGARVEVLGGLSNEEGDQLLTEWLAAAKRTLQVPQREEVLNKFEGSEGNPLYLKLASEEARLWPSADGQPPEKLALNVSGIIEKNMIHRLEDESNHGRVLVSHLLGYLAASRYGLAEDELVDLLSRDLQVYEWFLKKSYHLPADLIHCAIQYRRIHLSEPGRVDVQSHLDEERAALTWLKEIRTPPEKVADFLAEVLPKVDGPRLPVVLWSRLSFDLEPYLTERMVDGSPLMTFYHRELGDVSTKVFLKGGKEVSFHEKLADYFRFKADPKGDGSWTGRHIHGLSELPYHLTQAKLWDEVYETLTDFCFLEHKAAEVGVLERKDEKGIPVKTYTGVLQLQDDFEQALNAMPGEGGSGSSRVEYPLIITAVNRREGLTAYCPVCNQTSLIKEDQLDRVITCPNPECDRKLKINPFFTQMVQGS